jgi:phosphopantothenoylcysteine decarboxylase
MTSILCECLGRGTLPMIAVPCLKMDLVRHPAFARSIALLQEYGVRVLHESERYKSPLIVPRDNIFATLHEMIALY